MYWAGKKVELQNCEKRYWAGKQLELQKLGAEIVMDSAGRPLQLIAQSFTGLAAELQSPNKDLQLAAFANACSHVSFLFGCLGIAFKFAERDYVSKVQDLTVVSTDIRSLQSIVETDMKNDCVKDKGSHSRNLLRVKRGLDMIRFLFQGILGEKKKSLRDPASKAYGQVFGPHHSFPIRAAVQAGLYTLPTTTQLLKMLHEDEDSAQKLMQEYTVAADPVIKYVDDLFLSQGLGIDW